MGILCDSPLCPIVTFVVQFFNSMMIANQQFNKSPNQQITLFNFAPLLLCEIS